MMIALHKQARTTPAVRAELAGSKEPVAVLARRFNITEPTVRKWKSRKVFCDRSHTAHRLQATLTSGLTIRTTLNAFTSPRLRVEVAVPAWIRTADQPGHG